MPWSNLGNGNLGVPLELLNDPIAIKDAVACLEVFIGQTAGVPFITPRTPVGPWVNWLGASNPSSFGGNTSPSYGATYLGASKDSSQCLELYASAADGSIGLRGRRSRACLGPSTIRTGLH
jgi:hypothetical protein